MAQTSTDKSGLIDRDRGQRGQGERDRNSQRCILPLAITLHDLLHIYVPGKQIRVSLVMFC